MDALLQTKMMTLYQYFKSLSISSDAILSANSEVSGALEESGKPLR